MGMDDRDYMRERRIAQRETGHLGAARKMVIPLMLACGVLAAAYWIIDRSLPGLGKRTSSDLPAPQQDKPAPAATQSSTRGAAQPPSKNTAAIYKCVINGKTVYTDHACPKGAENRPLELRDSAGFVSPPKENLEELTARRVANENAYAASLARQAPSTRAISKKTECEGLDKSIESYDSMARQPHSGQMQDWLRQERTKVRDRQFAIHC